MQDSMDSASALLSRLAQHDIIAFVPRADVAGSTSASGSELLTTQELAQLLRVDPSSVRRWRTSVPPQGPPYVRISGRVVKYRRADVDRWLADRRVDPEVA